MRARGLHGLELALPSKPWREFVHYCAIYSSWRGGEIGLVFAFFALESAVQPHTSPHCRLTPYHPNHPDRRCPLWAGGGALDGKERLCTPVSDDTGPSQTPITSSRRRRSREGQRGVPGEPRRRRGSGVTAAVAVYGVLNEKPTCVQRCATPKSLPRFSDWLPQEKVVFTNRRTGARAFMFAHILARRVLRL